MLDRKLSKAEPKAHCVPKNLPDLIQSISSNTKYKTPRGDRDVIFLFQLLSSNIAVNGKCVHYSA